ncbi:TIGR03943 family protein [Gottfriedia sp. NPDC056225]|uniref:TIGR03943 family putative permease subunit n=1 Tax=Gottfriedia sp. NPDC056225 TaxID=3345751 RepID=UPI0035E32C10
MKNKISSTTIHHFIKAAILLGLAIYIFQLTLTDEILQFIVPELVIYIKIATGILFIVVISQIYIAVLSLKRHVIICDCGHDHSHDQVFGHEHHHLFKKSILKDILIYSLFLLPLFLGYLLPNHASSSSLASNKEMNFKGLAVQSSSSGHAVEVKGNEDPALKKLFKTNVYDQDYAKLGMRLYKQNIIEMKDKWFIEKLQSMNTFVDNFQNKQIKIKGFIYRDPKLAGNQFIVARMGMTHCIADISPFGIIAESTDAQQFVNNSWVTITGTIGNTNFNGQTVIKINVEKSEPAKSPSVQYVYPDWNFGSKL